MNVSECEIPKDKELIECKNCGKGFIDFKSKNRKFCSRKCSLEFNFDFSPEAQAEKAKLRKQFDAQNLKKFLDGLILGDGHIQKKENKFSNPSFRYLQTFSSRHRDWAEEIRDYFQDSNMKASLCENDYFDKRTEKTYHQVFLQSRMYDSFEKFYRRWYRNGSKIVPKDLDFDRELLTNWYLGDGNLDIRNRNNLIIKFSTDCFQRRDINILISKFKKIGIGVKMSENLRLFLYKTRDVKKLFTRMRNDVPKSFDYKMEVV